MNLRAGDSVSALAKVAASRSADADGATDELSLEEITGEAEINESAAGLPEANGSGGGEVA